MSVLPMHASFRRRIVVGVTGALGLIAFGAQSASAHVTVQPPNAQVGGYDKLTFRVPNETDDAATTKLTVELPADTPLPSVSVKPVSGWTVDATPTPLAQPAEVDGTTLTEAVTSITWTATGSGIAPGEFQEFDVVVGPLPDVDRLVLPAVQTYDDGEVVEWTDPPNATTEPEHPAPVVSLEQSDPPSTAADAIRGDATSDDPVARSLGTAGVVLGVGGLGIGALASRRRSAA